MKFLALALGLLAAAPAFALVGAPVHTVTGAGHVLSEACPDAYQLVVQGTETIGGEGWGFSVAIADTSLPITCGLLAAQGTDYSGAFDPRQGGCVEDGAGSVLCLLDPQEQPGTGNPVQYKAIVVADGVVLQGVALTVVS